jgi:hypothetical protein
MTRDELRADLDELVDAGAPTERDRESLSILPTSAWAGVGLYTLKAGRWVKATAAPAVARKVAHTPRVLFLLLVSVLALRGCLA